MIEVAPVDLSKTRKSVKSATERTLKWLRDSGHVCGIVERWNPRIKHKKHDLFGIIDIIALTPKGVVGVQSTGTDFAGHLKKLTVTNVVDSARWLTTPGTRLLLIGWRKVKGSTGVLHYEPRTKWIDWNDLRPELERRGERELLRKMR